MTNTDRRLANIKAKLEKTRDRETDVPFPQKPGPDSTEQVSSRRKSQRSRSSQMACTTSCQTYCKGSRGCKGQ